MRFRLLRYALLPLLAGLLLTACHGKDDPAIPGGSTPEAALQTSVELLKASDVGGVLKHALPPADYATLRADWSQHEANPAPITAEDRVKFSEMMQKFTAPDAENKLYIELQPKLTLMEQQYRDQLPVLISIGAALVKSGVAQNTTLTAGQKAQANGVVDVMLPWVQQTSWFDQAKVRQAIVVAVATARKLELKSLDELRTMNFDTTMKKYSLGFAGTRQLLAIYGLSVDDTLNSIKLTPVSNANGHAVLKIDYTLLGKPLSTEFRLVQQDDRWYNEDMVNNVRKSHQDLSQSATATPTAAIQLSVPATVSREVNVDLPAETAKSGTTQPLE